VEDDRHFAGGTDQMRLDNLQHEGGRDGGVERVAALFQNGHARSGGKPVGCRDDTKRAEDLGPCRNHLQTPFNQLSRGSSASRKPSPRRLKPSTTRKIAPPGKIDIQGACVMKFFAVFSIEPQDGLGGCWPRPRKERLASAMMAVATVIVA